jgi:hypothetical protein
MIQRSTSAVADTEGPQPACTTTARSTQEWRETEYTDRLSVFYDPCQCPECFPQKVVGSEIERVVLSRHHPGSFHRSQQSEPSETVAVASDGGSIDDPFDDCERVPVTGETEFCRGDGIIWDEIDQPLIVHAFPSPDVVHLKGPDSGDYFLEIRSGMADVISPGYGKLSALYRIIR